MKNRDEIFKLYIDPDNFREMFHTPFFQNGYIYASNGSIALRVCGNMLKKKNILKSQKPDCSNLFPETEKEKTVSVNQLNKLLWAADMIEKTTKTATYVKCKECEGSGKVTWQYGDYTRDCECPVCNGSGNIRKTEKVNIEKRIFNKDAIIKLEGSEFRAEHIQIIVKTMKLLEITEAKMQWDKNTKSMKVVFDFGNGIAVLIAETHFYQI
ncbi:MAG: hypothetical protein LBB73_06440 [Dysgonamonadaceae bacterium]|jgi:hypothetical protein|nr:hypothetical protein [Dysgonamonadaceae bacterium]